MLYKLKCIIKNKLRKLCVELMIIRFKNNRKNNNKQGKTKKNILILIPRLNNGGAEKVTSNLADELSKKYNVILVTQLEKTQYDYQCNVPRIVLNPQLEKDNSFTYLLKQIKQLKQIKKEKEIDHTISFCTRMNYINVMSRVNDEVIISIRNYLSEAEKEEKNIYQNKKSAKYADKIVVVSEILAKEQVEKFNANKDKIYVINNFCDSEKINDKLSQEMEESNFNYENTVINIGRLTHQKGQIHLINAFRKVVDKIPNAKLIILGQGELKEKLEQRIDNLNLSKNVFLLSFKKNPYIYLKKSKIFVLSSFYEGMSNAILEAMYCNLPIISTDCKSGTREIIAPNTNLDFVNTEVTKEKYGILVPVIKSEEDEALLAEAIIELLEDKQLRTKYSKLSSERIKYFSKESIMKKWIDVIEK